MQGNPGFRRQGLNAGLFDEDEEEQPLNARAKAAAKANVGRGGAAVNNNMRGQLAGRNLRGMNAMGGDGEGGDPQVGGLTNRSFAAGEQVAGFGAPANMTGLQVQPQTDMMDEADDQAMGGDGEGGDPQVGAPTAGFGGMPAGLAAQVGGLGPQVGGLFDEDEELPETSPDAGAGMAPPLMTMVQGVNDQAMGGDGEGGDPQAGGLFDVDMSLAEQWSPGAGDGDPPPLMTMVQAADPEADVGDGSSPVLGEDLLPTNVSSGVPGYMPDVETSRPPPLMTMVQAADPEAETAGPEAETGGPWDTEQLEQEDVDSRELQAFKDELAARRAEQIQRAQAASGLAGMGLSGASATLVGDEARKAERAGDIALAQFIDDQERRKFQDIQRQVSIWDLEVMDGVDYDGDGNYGNPEEGITDPNDPELGPQEISTEQQDILDSLSVVDWNIFDEDQQPGQKNEPYEIDATDLVMLQSNGITLRDAGEKDNFGTMFKLYRDQFGNYYAVRQS